MLPPPLKAGIEHLSGLDMDDVTVHRRSALPARIHAKAYAQGSEIHLAPGQERHLAHEAWHVVQQKEGAAQPSVGFPESPANFDPELEHQADVMGAQAERVGQASIARRQSRPQGLVARTPDAGVLQGQWEEYLLPLLTSTVAGLLGAGAVLYYRWWPPARSVSDLRSIYQHVAIGDVLTFARIAGWNSPSVIQLASNYAAGPNGLTAAQWAALAARFPPNATADTTAFAQIPGWTPAGLNPLATAFVANPHGLTAAGWVNIAAQLPQDAHAEAVDFASIPGWNLGAITAVIADFTNNNHGLTAADWANAAANVPMAAHPVVALIAGRAAGTGIVAGTPFTAPQMHRAAAIYTASGQLAHVRQWIAAGRKAAAAPMLPIVGPLAGPPPGPALDVILGPGSHLAIRNAITAAGHGAAYTANPFVRTHAQGLIGAGFTQADSLTLLTALCSHAATAGAFDRGVDLALAMRGRAIPFAEIHTFVTTSPALALGAAWNAALTNPGAAQDALVARPGANAADLTATLTILQPLGGPVICALLTQQFPATPGLTLRRLLRRLQNFTGPVPLQNIPIGNVANEFAGIEQSINQRVNNGTMSPAARDWIRQSFRLITGATRAGMLGFLGDHRVTNSFTQGQATNPAYWLSLFARYHRGAPPGGFATVVVPVVFPGGISRNVNVDNHIIVHVQQRHTYEHFRLQPGIINRALQSTLVYPPETANGISAAIQNILANPQVVQAWPWNGQVPIDVGAVQLRIQSIGGQWYVRQYFYGVAPGLGHAVDQNFLHCIAAHFPSLVY